MCVCARVRVFRHMGTDFGTDDKKGEKDGDFERGFTL